MINKGTIAQLPFINEFRRRRHVSKWIQAGRPIPVPHEVKQLTILTYATGEEASVFVETGTFLGDTIWEQRHHFRQLYSIELSRDLFEKARRRFASVENVKLLHGDSGDELRKVIAELKSPALFWLDGHYSGEGTAKGQLECPILEELRHVFGSPFQHTILIDDARLFVGEHDYPTIAELKQFVREHGNHSIRIQNDIIVLLPHRD